MKPKLNQSYSSISKFLDCKKKYWWTYVRGLEPKVRSLAFITGELIHSGVGRIYAKNSNFIEDTIVDLNKIRIDFRNNLQFAPAEEQKFIELEYVIRGMLEAYAITYSDLIKTFHPIQNEYKIQYKLHNGITLVCILDNIMTNDTDLYIHELKSTKTLNDNYVKNIQNNLQISIYFHTFNCVSAMLEHKGYPQLTGKKIAGIVFDVIQKPGIKRKKLESYDDFLVRLIKYYTEGNDYENFYMEFIKYPLKTERRIMDGLLKITDDILACTKDEDFYCNDTACFTTDEYSYYGYRCSFYEICHSGENPSTLLQYKERNLV